EPLTQVLYQEREQVAHLFEVRRIIETQAACLAAERCTAADAQRLRTLNREFEQGLHDRDLAYDANMRFHLGIVETAKNPILTEILGPLLTATVEVYATAREQSLSSTSNLARFVLEHEEIVEAIAHKETELSADLLAAHIDGAQRRVEQVMRAR
ncbi:MAG: FCD domain-containing protein, partial [Anaerolineae bacterium]|nr:FCD domain-containing protein [Anaerolineae bacterium]